MVGTLVGFTMFLLLLLLAVQTLVHLYAASTLSAVANEAADQVANTGGAPASVAVAERTAMSRLGTFGARHTRFLWEEVDGNRVVVRVVAASPQLLPLPVAWTRITATVAVRTERFR